MQTETQMYEDQASGRMHSLEFQGPILPSVCRNVQQAVCDSMSNARVEAKYFDRRSLWVNKAAMLFAAEGSVSFVAVFSS